jgi:ubiquinone/menaquinone biosynthesis C-methylase UbiE
VSPDDDGVEQQQHWFEGIAEFLGPAYLRYSFTMGTVQECDFLVDVLGLTPGMRVLDVGCGPGRHAHEMAKRGVLVHGVDISARFVELAQAVVPDGTTFEVGDARHLGFDAEFDAAYSLCQGGFGLVAEDGAVLGGMARALRPGGGVVVSAFSAYFQLRYLEITDTFDADTGVNHERTTLRDLDGNEQDTDLWTTCYTPRELRLLAASVGLEPEAVYSVTTGRYDRRAPNIDEAEFLLVARRR